MVIKILGKISDASLGKGRRGVARQRKPAPQDLNAYRNVGPVLPG